MTGRTARSKRAADCRYPLRTERRWERSLIIESDVIRTARLPEVTGFGITCIECQQPWRDPRERWRLKVTDEQPPETVPYCPSCATREFGPARIPRPRV